MGEDAFTRIAFEALALGYLPGSIPFGLFFAFVSGGGDVRKIGSGGTGATNVLRTGKKWPAAATLICDAGKGAAAVLLAQRLFAASEPSVIAAAGAVLGHIFPVWLKFRGGKGVATAFGVMLALYWPVALIAAATWLATAIVTRISSLSALVTALTAPIYMYLFHQNAYVSVTIIIALLVIVMHHANIRRLLNGTEPRIGSKDKVAG